MEPGPSLGIHGESCVGGRGQSFRVRDGETDKGWGERDHKSVLDREGQRGTGSEETMRATEREERIRKEREKRDIIR